MRDIKKERKKEKNMIFFTQVQISNKSYIIVTINYYILPQ